MPPNSVQPSQSTHPQISNRYSHSVHFKTHERSDKATRDEPLLLGLLLPSLILIATVMIIPLIWLSLQSFIDEHGQFTFRYYSQLISDSGYFGIYKTTFKISFFVVALCSAIGYPLTYLLVQFNPRLSNVLLLCVLVPFWTPVLVRTYAWLVLLQRKGVINEALLDLRIVDQPLDLAFNQTATVIGMVHIMLPYFVLPLYASMRSINVEYLHASTSLGASPSRTFWRVFFPLSLPGFAGGAIIVFVLCLGFYVVPAILGGGRVIMIAQRIADSVTIYSNWGPAAALGVALFGLAAGILTVFTRIFGRSSRLQVPE